MLPAVTQQCSRLSPDRGIRGNGGVLKGCGQGAGSLKGVFKRWDHKGEGLSDGITREAKGVGH